MLKIATLAALVLTATTSPSFALTSKDGSDEARRACTPDVFRLCGAFIPDVNKITACLKDNKKNLSPACKAVFSSKK
ncbi:MAG: hypothetical protein KGS72_24975 [Cyanobacteria bacterium REEB67]|nr:hypothetical protein [Cyanobacteria bacterium REEB67]